MSRSGPALTYGRCATKSNALWKALLFLLGASFSLQLGEFQKFFRSNFSAAPILLYKESV